MHTDLIFVYGLLKSTYSNDAARFVRSYCEFVGAGSFPGALYDLGNYPGAVYEENSDSLVHGEVYRILRNEKALVQFLDKFEGVGEEFPHPNEYIRKFISVNMDGQIIKASCYLYNWNLDGIKVIESGNYDNRSAKRS